MNSEARVHSRQAGNSGEGYLVQYLPTKVLPTRFRVNYSQEVGTGCGAVFMGLIMGERRESLWAGPRLSYLVGETDVGGDIALVENFLGRSAMLATYDKSFERGIFEAVFDYSRMRLTVYATGTNETRSTNFAIPSLEAVATHGMYVGAINNCWDGRDDQEGAFDNVLFEGVPADRDSDGDSYTDWLEWRYFSDPNDRSSLPEIIEVRVAVEIQFITNLGKRYQLEKSTNLIDWTPEGEVFDGTGGRISRLISTQGQRSTFWRLKRVE